MALLTTAEAAAKLGISRSRVLAMIRDRRLKAEKVGRDWIIQEADLSASPVANRKPGRPRKKTSN
jgi:excisionase family DNA binding protein